MRRRSLNGLAAAFSGLLLALSFPTPAWSVLAWVALVPLLVSADTHPFRKGWGAGFLFFSVVLYWLNIVMTTYGGLSVSLSLAAYLLLAAYLALYFGGALWLAVRLKARRGFSLVLTLPVIWVGFEAAREVLLTGFPWATLGYSQQHLWLIQSADLFGVYGVSFLIVLCNATLAEVVLALRRNVRLPYGALLVLIGFLVLNAGYGYLRLGQSLEGRQEQIDVAVIQGNIDQSIKWDPAYRESTVKRYRDLSRQSGRQNDVALVVWPEAATPFYFQDGGPLVDRVRALPQELGVHLLFGSPAYQGTAQHRSFLNSAFLLTPEGVVSGRSDKVHLVPFGEYVPLSTLLPFIEKLVVGIGDFSPGEIRPLKLGERKIGVLICYEAIFPGLARRFVEEGSDLLVNLTNDAWFGRSSAPAQHLAMVRYRAIENRVWIARAANTGISAFVTPAGRILQSTRLFETDARVVRVGMGARPGLYVRLGYLIPWLFLAVSLYWLVSTWFTRFSRNRF